MDMSEMVRGYQQACVVMAAAELELFDRVGGESFTAKEAARAVGADLRATAALLNALAAIGVIRKAGERYRIPAAIKTALTTQGSGSVLAMVQHQATCLRRWSHLAEVVKTGRLAPRTTSIRGAKAEYASFIEAMDNIGRSTAPKLVAELQPLKFSHLLDVGGASGTYTIAFLRANRQARATIFDLLQVLPQAKKRLADAGLSRRVDLVAGDFYVDPLPQGADLVWLSAIVHQNSRQQNRALFEKAFAALTSGGQLLVRDFLMSSSRTTPAAGALFAINMLVATPQGGTFTVNELRDDLTATGFTKFRVLKQDGTMQSVISARKP